MLVRPSCRRTVPVSLYRASVYQLDAWSVKPDSSSPHADSLPLTARLAERRTLRKAAGKKWRDRAYLFVNETGVKALMTYVRETGRMRWGRREEDGGRPEGNIDGEKEGDYEDGERKEEGVEEDDDEGDTEEREDTTMEGLLRWFARSPKERGPGENETQRERDATTRAA